MSLQKDVEHREYSGNSKMLFGGDDHFKILLETFYTKVWLEEPPHLARKLGLPDSAVAMQDKILVKQGAGGSSYPLAGCFSGRISQADR